MTEADLVSWLVKPGDRVAKGDLIAELETEKSTVEFESPVSGTLLEIVVPEGTNGVQVGTVIAIFDAPSEDARAPVSAPAAPAESPAPREPAQEARPLAPPPPGRKSDVAVTPVARRLAERSGVDLEAVTGTGSGGRIVKADVEAASDAKAAPAPEAESREGGSTLVPLSRMRRTIAARLAEAKRTIPHFYLSADCEIDRLLETRARLNEEERGISVNDLVVRAAALALVEVPEANVSFTDEGLVRYERIDVAVAVATEGGLIAPVVRGADRKALVELSQEIRDLAARAREGKLAPHEYQGGTFTVSNLGMYGVGSVYPILNPPQSCILGVGAGVKKPVVRNDELAVGTVMTLTLSADHRAVDGALGARLLAAVKRRLEDPLDMLL
jgi:pyruvate dehydrogenase E2 component (dihydrolipoamide acetyltransferase)